MKKLNRRYIEKYKGLANEIRKDILRMHALSGNSHIGSSFSVVEILVAIYFCIFDKVALRGFKEEKRDRLILSKGHAASSLYAVLAKRGLFHRNLLKEYCADGGRLPGHCTINCVPGVEVSSGSLGHGLSIGAGLALGSHLDKSNFKTYVILSDGECQEGSVWEAAMFSSHHKLDNLIAIVDYNRIQAFGESKDVLNLEPFRDKWSAFGWSVKGINGHSFHEIISSLRKVPFAKGKPSLIIANTVKGKGISFMENSLLWHYKSPDDKELAKALLELSQL